MKEMEEQVFNSPVSVSDDQLKGDAFKERILFFERNGKGDDRKIRPPANLDLSDDSSKDNLKSEIKVCREEKEHSDSLKNSIHNDIEEDNIFASTEFESNDEESVVENREDIRGCSQDASAETEEEKQDGFRDESSRESIRKFEEKLKRKVVDYTENEDAEDTKNKPYGLSLEPDNNIETNPLEKPAKSILPKSSEFLENFIKSEDRPAFLHSPLLKQKPAVHSKTLYINNRLIFSNCHTSKLKQDFRAPGIILGSRPSISLKNSVISEDGILHYVKVSAKVCTESPNMKNKNAFDSEDGMKDVCWYLLKDIFKIGCISTNSFAEVGYFLNLMSSDDTRLNTFILSDIVSTVHRRTNYLFFDGCKYVGKFVGSTLCICINDRIIKILCLGDKDLIWKEDDLRISVDGHFISFSCKAERDEWFDVIMGSTICQ